VICDCGADFEPIASGDGCACKRKFCERCGAAAPDHEDGCAAVSTAIAFRKGASAMSAFQRATEIAKQYVKEGKAKSLHVALNKVWDDYPELYAESKRDQPRPAAVKKAAAPIYIYTPTFERVVREAKALVDSGDGKLTLPKAISIIWNQHPDWYAAHQAEQLSGVRVTPHAPHA